MAKYLAILTFITTATLAAIPPQDAQPGVDEILGRLQAASDALTSFEAEFEQLEKDEFGDINTTSGKAYFLKPGRMLFVSYHEGEKLEELGKNTEYAWRVRHHVGTVDRFKVNESENVSEGLNITNAEELKEQYDLKLAGVEELSSGPAWHLIGTPKKEGKIKKIEVWVDQNNAAPVVKAKSYQRRIETTFTLSNISRGEHLDAGMFRYDVPRGYDEIVH